MSIDPITNFIAGGLAGAAGTTVTCPLEVIKTRLQTAMGQNVMKTLQAGYRFVPSTTSSAIAVQSMSTTTTTASPMMYLRHILYTEGFQALFKGLAPSLFGIIPTRALYFTAYSQAKQFYNGIFRYESPAVHLVSAISAGAITATCTSPIWVVKTQLQLENRPGRRSTMYRSIKKLYRLDGMKGFYRGLTASYAGTVETAIHFVIYEHLKKRFKERREDYQMQPLDCILAAGLAKMTASSTCYPHEVVRTRLRQQVSRDQRKYHNFVQTLLTVWREEGLRRGLYGGMSAHLIRVVPNTAIVFLTYEAVVNIISHYHPE